MTSLKIRLPADLLAAARQLARDDFENNLSRLIREALRRELARKEGQCSPRPN